MGPLFSASNNPNPNVEPDVVMKNLKTWFWLVTIGALILPAPAAAQTVYVTESFEITLRAGPGVDRRIVQLIPSARELELLERGDEWSRVRTPGGSEGWVLNRYITTSQPCSMVLERVTQDNDLLTAQVADLKKSSAELEAQTTQLRADLAQSRRISEEVNQAYETLKSESADFLRIRSQNQQLTAELESERTRSAKLDEENMQMKRDHFVQWVLTGGGIMLVGFFIGLFSASRRKARSSLY